jgi:hypothetical protein
VSAEPLSKIAGVPPPSLKQRQIGKVPVALHALQSVIEMISFARRERFWKTATAAELQLLQAKYPEAAALYRAAVVMAPGDAGSHDTSHTQAKLLSQALGASDVQRALIDAAFR